MAKKDIIGQYTESFKVTSNGLSFAQKKADLKIAYKKAIRPYVIAKKEAEAKLEKDRKLFNYNCGQINSRNESIRWTYENSKKKDVTVQKILADLAKLEEEEKSAIKVYAEKIEGNEAWNNLVHRKATPKLLQSMLNHNGATEMQMELDLHGCLTDSGKQNRFCFPIESMEILGWIERVGSGKVGDAKVCNLTDEGKRQLDFYNNYGMFDSSKVA